MASVSCQFSGSLVNIFPTVKEFLIVVALVVNFRSCKNHSMYRTSDSAVEGEPTIKPRKPESRVETFQNTISLKHFEIRKSAAATNLRAWRTRPR
jgi:hypothetical protein